MICLLMLRWAGRIRHAMLERQCLLVPNHRMEMVSLAYVCSELRCIAISRLDGVRIVHFRCLPHRGQIQSDGKESSVICCRDNCWLGNWLCPLRISSKRCVLRVFFAFRRDSCQVLARDSFKKASRTHLSPKGFLHHAFHFCHAIPGAILRRFFESSSSSLIFFFQNIVSVFICSDADRAISRRRIQSVAFSVPSAGIQCRHLFVKPRSGNVQPCNSDNARHFTSGMNSFSIQRILIVCARALAHDPLLLFFPDFKAQVEVLGFSRHANRSGWHGCRFHVPCLFH